MSGGWSEVCELAVDPDRALVHVEGWQSWTPTTTYRLDDRQFLPRASDTWEGNYGGSRPRPPAGVFQGDGLLVIDPGAGSAVVAVGALAPFSGKRRTTGMREGNERVLHRRFSESRWP